MISSVSCDQIYYKRETKRGNKSNFILKHNLYYIITLLFYNGYFLGMSRERLSFQ